MPVADEGTSEVDAQARARARERLARELHDQLTHRVSSVSLQVMGHRASDDVVRLRRSMDSIAAAAGDILPLLGLLDRVLRAHPFDVLARPAELDPDLAHLTVCDPVTDVVGRLVSLLREAGLQVDCSVSPTTDQAGALARRTIEEAVVATHGWLLRHALPGARCTVVATNTVRSVELQISAQVSSQVSSQMLESDARFVALEERVRLLEGTFSADVRLEGDEHQWTLALRLRDR